MFASDTLTLDAPKRTKDGYLAVRARAARTGVYDYTGVEVDPENKHGLRDKAIVKVLRDEQTVFDKKAAHSFIGKPVTDDHPAVSVNASNWRDHARGTIMGAEWQQGGYLAFDLLLTDADAIAKIDAGKRELSNGYSTDLEYGEFKAADGTICHARQTNITGNHIALVDRGRAGPECRIADATKPFAVCDANPAALADLSTTKEPVMAGTITIDGLPVSLADETAVRAVITKLTDRAEKAETDLATVTTDKAKLEAEKVTLEKQLADAKLTPAQLRDAAKAYAQTVDKAKALGVTVSDDMDAPAMMKAAVTAKVGDAAKDWNDAQIAASFATLTADAKVVQNIAPPRSVTAQDGRAAVSSIRAQRYA